MSTVPPPHRLVLTAGELAYLVAKTGVELPPAWRPNQDTKFGTAESELTKKKVVTGSGSDAEVHRSVELNLQILAKPTAILETVATASGRGLRCVHAICGRLGASLFDLGEGAVELSMFAAVHLGRELIRAVPEPPTDGVGSTLDGGATPSPPEGRVRLAALQEIGAARVLADAEPGLEGMVLDELGLPADEAKVARQVAARSDGALRCTVMGRSGDQVMSSNVTWLHTDAGWTAMEPDPDGSDRRMVRLVPTQRESLGTWVAPALAEVL